MDFNPPPSPNLTQIPSLPLNYPGGAQIQIEPNYIFPHLTLVAAYAEMGKMEEAHAEVNEVMRIRPNYSVKLVPSSFPWKEQDELDRLADLLRKAGMPE